jgi:deoxyadenosine/deoxycytidine kinase
VPSSTGRGQVRVNSTIVMSDNLISRYVANDNLNGLKRKKNDEFYISKKIKIKNEAKIIVLTGTIAVGKTTFKKELIRYLEDNEKRVFSFKETSLMMKSELKIFYRDVKSHALFFESKIIDYYAKIIEYVRYIRDAYDYVIFDRTHLDTEIFSILNIFDLESLSYLKEKREEINFNLEDVYKVIHLKPSVENMIKRQRERNRDGEMCTEEYLKDLYNLYENMIFQIYPDHVTYENNCDVSEYREYFKNI